jgi:hypothetical protein
LIGFSNQIKPKKEFSKIVQHIYKKIEMTHSADFFDHCIGSIIALDSFTIFKKRPSETEFNKQAQYVGFNHSTEDEYHFGLQFLLTGILAAYYHETRKTEIRPGFTSFPTGRSHDIELGTINVENLR